MCSEDASGYTVRADSRVLRLRTDHKAGNRQIRTRPWSDHRSTDV